MVLGKVPELYYFYLPSCVFWFQQRCLY